MCRVCGSPCLPPGPKQPHWQFAEKIASYDTKLVVTCGDPICVATFPEKGIKISDKEDFLHVCLFDGISVNANKSGTRGPPLSHMSMLYYEQWSKKCISRLSSNESSWHSVFAEHYGWTAEDERRRWRRITRGLVRFGEVCSSLPGLCFIYVGHQTLGSYFSSDADRTPGALIYCLI